MIVFQYIITLKALVASLIGRFCTSIVFAAIFLAKLLSTEIIFGLNFNTNTMITLTIVFLIFSQIFILSLYHLINKESKMSLLDKKIYKKFIIN